MHERLIKVRAITGARNEAIEPLGTDTLCVKVREKPELNRANKRIIELVADHFGIPTKQVRIVTGHQAPSKILSIHL